MCEEIGFLILVFLRVFRGSQIWSVVSMNPGCVISNFSRKTFNLPPTAWGTLSASRNKLRGRVNVWQSERQGELVLPLRVVQLCCELQFVGEWAMGHYCYPWAEYVPILPSPHSCNNINYMYTYLVSTDAMTGQHVCANDGIITPPPSLPLLPQAQWGEQKNSMSGRRIKPLLLCSPYKISPLYFPLCWTILLLCGRC